MTLRTDFIRDEGLERFLSGKRVALIGPSPHLVNRSLGVVLDGYDVVCRVNEIIPVGYESDYGSRTDIAFLNCATLSLSDFIYKMRESGAVAEQLKYIICPVVKVQHDFRGSAIDNAAIINIYDTPFIHIGHDNYNLIYNEYGVEPTSGSVALLMLLQYSIKELLISGISFYMQGSINSPETHEEGFKLYYHGNYPPTHELSIVNPWKSHPMMPQIEYFKKRVLTEYASIIKIDSYLNYLLDCNYHNILQIG